MLRQNLLLRIGIAAEEASLKKIESSFHECYLARMVSVRLRSVKWDQENHVP